MAYVVAFHKMYFCFPNAVWATASGGFRIVSYTLLYLMFDQNEWMNESINQLIRIIVVVDFSQPTAFRCWWSRTLTGPTSVLCGVEIRPFSLLWPVAYTTACKAVNLELTYFVKCLTWLLVLFCSPLHSTTDPTKSRRVRLLQPFVGGV